MLRTSSRGSLLPVPNRGKQNYIELCNMVCRRLNEVEIPIEEFLVTRGIQSLIKDAVVASIQKINQAEFEWPFNAAEHTEILVKGQVEYAWPVHFKTVDYNTFQIVRDADLNVGHKTLRLIERDEWYSKHRDRDYDAGEDGRGVPDFVCASHGSGFGVSPSPNNNYTLRFRYYLSPATMHGWDDACFIPPAFNDVIINGALYHMYMFRDNAEASAATLETFKAGLKDMQILLMNSPDYLRDTRVNF